MIIKIRFFLLAAVFVSVPCAAFSQSRSPSPAPADQSGFQQGLEAFGNGNYTDALYNFREALLNETGETARGNTYFWLAKTHLALNNLDDAEKNIEYFLFNFENNPNYPEGLYQKGRLLYLQKEYENSLQVLYGFLEQFPSNPYAANSYYWIGECLYSLGHLDKAEKVFTHVVQEYPASFKVEASKYKLNIIGLKRREEELLTFLKWSHEESLKTLEEFQIREKTYEQALAAYQKKLAEYAEAGAARRIEELTLDVREKEAEIAALNKQTAELSRLVEDLQTDDTGGPQQSSADLIVASSADAPLLEELRKKEHLLSLKEDALSLKEDYLEWLFENLEN